MSQAVSDPVLLPSAPVTPEGAAFSNTILVADDDHSMLMLMEYILTRAGYEVLTAEDGEQALKMVGETRPALVVLDCDMPKLDGLEVCRRIKRDPELAGTPIIFMTTLSSPTDKARGYAAGGDDYIVKPPDRVELLSRVRKQLDLTRTQVQVHQQAKLLNAQADRLAPARGDRQSLLADVSKFADLKVALHYQPAAETTGDYYDIRRLSPDDTAVLIAQVEGRPLQGYFAIGVMKALTATFVNAALSVPESLMLLNAGLCNCLGPNRRISACYARISRAGSHLELGRAGVLAPLLQTTDGHFREIDAFGDALGVREDAGFETQSMHVDPGQRLFLFTQGILENAASTVGSDAGYDPEEVRTRLRSGRGASLDQAVALFAPQRTAGAGQRDLLLMGLEF
ncbi:MAG TPA: response regulator [Phycisphaerae bacterium]|nr:response regulator [Phycisphaerae bacterium]